MISSQQLLLPLIGVWLKVTGLDNCGINKEHTLEPCLGSTILVALSLAGCCDLDSIESAALAFEQGHGSIEKKKTAHPCSGTICSGAAL